jgi:hypothetical protein
LVFFASRRRARGGIQCLSAGVRGRRDVDRSYVHRTTETDFLGASFLLLFLLLRLLAVPNLAASSAAANAPLFFFSPTSFAFRYRSHFLFSSLPLLMQTGERVPSQPPPLAVACERNCDRHSLLAPPSTSESRAPRASKIGVTTCTGSKDSLSRLGELAAASSPPSSPSSPWSCRYRFETTTTVAAVVVATGGEVEAAAGGYFSCHQT